ncbi:MAG: LytTR family DNA-binding domain-containing protein [Terricaulis sp.]
MIVHAAILDDERIIAADLANQLSRREGWKVVGAFLEGAHLETCVADNSVDVCFLDIEVPGTDGLSLARRLKAIRPRLQVVFVTAYHQYAATAFRIEALDYLVKPATPEALAEACRRVEDRLRGAMTAPPERIAVFSAGRIDYVPLDDIIAAKAAGNYVALVTQDGEFLHRITLSELADSFVAAGFVRTHRSHLVRPREIVSARTRGDGIVELKLSNGAVAPVSETYRTQLAEVIAGSLVKTHQQE